MIIDDNGRLAARRGWSAVTTTPISGTPDIKALGEYIDAAGASTIISAANNKIYSGTTTLTERTGTITTPTADDWKFMNFNTKVVGMQTGHTPIVGTGGAFANITASSGTLPTGHACLSAFGRIFAASSPTDKSTLKWCSLLDETAWASGSAGSLDLRQVWPSGMDEITALAEFQGKLVIFGRKSILIYTGAGTPGSMVLADAISGIGCISRDTLQDIGTDLLFLSDSGIRSLGRTVQNETAPLQDLSLNIRDYFKSLVASETENSIRTVYHEKQGYYLLSLPTAGFTFCFDLKHVTDNELPVVTLWRNINPTALLSATDGTLYFGKAGVLGQYSSLYRDNGVIYNAEFVSAWTDFGDQVSGRVKIPKKMVITIAGGYGYTVTSKWAYDFNTFYTTQSNTVKTLAGGSVVAEYGIAEYGIAEFGTAGDAFSSLTSYLNKTGKHMKFGFQTTIDGQPFKIQKVEIQTKLGRI